MKFIRTASRYLETVLLFSSAFAPVLAADMMASEAQKIKVTLNNILQTDDSLRKSYLVTVLSCTHINIYYLSLTFNNCLQVIN